MPNTETPLWHIHHEQKYFIATAPTDMRKQITNDILSVSPIYYSFSWTFSVIAGYHIPFDCGPALNNFVLTARECKMPSVAPFSLPSSSFHSPITQKDKIHVKFFIILFHFWSNYVRVLHHFHDCMCSIFCCLTLISFPPSLFYTADTGAKSYCSQKNGGDKKLMQMNTKETPFCAITAGND